jgi:translation initiation factor 3 subunit M
VIATALSNPTVFDFDPLFKLDAVVATRSHPLFALLRIFFNGGVDDLHTWQRAHADVSSTFGAPPSLFYLFLFFPAAPVSSILT